MKINRLFTEDYERFTPNKLKILPCLIRLVRNHELRYLFWGRVFQCSRNPIIKLSLSVILRQYRRRYGLEIPFNGNVGGGIKLLHPWNITVNNLAKIGNNCTLYKGCTIGEIISGKRKGYPIVGNNVTIYSNATVCGQVNVGDNSIISAGAFVNFDVPPNSIVIGNPATVHSLKKM